LRHVPGLRGGRAPSPRHDRHNFREVVVSARPGDHNFREVVPIMGGTAVSGRLAGRAFVLPGLLLVLVALGGRYTVDRAGWRDLQWVDLRLVGVAIGITVLAVDLARRPRPHLDRRHLDRRPEGWLVVAMLFFLYQIASGLWAPASVRVGPNALDIFLMGTLTVA